VAKKWRNDVANWQHFLAVNQFLETSRNLFGPLQMSDLGLNGLKIFP